MIATETLVPALVDYLPRQRWFGGGHDVTPSITVTSLDVLHDAWPGLVRILADVKLGDAEPATYQLLLGLRPADGHSQFLAGYPDAIVGPLEADAGPALVYDATVDPELALELLHHVAPDEVVERARPLGGEQSNSSIVYDERLILKLFRRLPEGPNPDAEVTRALVHVGFENVATPVAEWRGGDTDFAVVNEFLAGGADGFHLALTSLRDLFDRKGDPQEAGGDFAPEASRLGDITGRLHVALAEAFGTETLDYTTVMVDMTSQLGRVFGNDADRRDSDRVEGRYQRMSGLDLGPAIRVHGDYHLGQVMRTDNGWYVLDFEGEPARPLEERRRPSSALKDVAGMLRSFHYAAEVALREWHADTDEEVRACAVAWEDRNGLAFLEGYFGAPGVDDVLPPDQAARDAVLDAFLLDKAVYEVGYERSHRPDWVEIPLSAVHRILESNQ